MTRSAGRGYAYSTWFVGASGGVTYYSAVYSSRFAPACVIGAKGEKNMGLMDAITAEDRVQLKVSDLETLMKNAAKADLIFNGIRAEVPHRYMREIITGKKEKDADETKAREKTGEQEHETTD